MNRQTLQRVPTPTALLVGLADELFDVCTEILGGCGLKVLRVRHISAAAERIPVTMPQIVLIPTSTAREEVEMLQDRCVAVGAELVELARDMRQAELTPLLRSAANRAFVKSLRQS